MRRLVFVMVEGWALRVEGSAIDGGEEVTTEGNEGNKGRNGTADFTEFTD